VKVKSVRDQLSASGVVENNSRLPRIYVSSSSIVLLVIESNSLAGRAQSTIKLSLVSAILQTFEESRSEKKFE